MPAQAVATEATEAVRAPHAGRSETDAELEELTAIIEAGVARSERRSRTFHVASPYFSTVLLFGGMIAFSHRFIRDPKGTVVLGLVYLFVVLTGHLGAHRWLNNVSLSGRERDAAKRLTEIDDARAVGPLMDVLPWTDTRTLRPELWQVLGRRWLRLSEDEAREIGKDRHYALAAWIQGFDPPVTHGNYAGSGNQPLLGMLHVISHVGLETFQMGHKPLIMRVSLRPILAKWANGKGAGYDPEVQQAAAACCDAIQHKMALAEPGEHLLRASAPIASSPESLLRPAQGTQQTDPQELLRPGDPR